MRTLVCLLLVAGAFVGVTPGSAQPRLGDELVAAPAVWRAFRPLVLATGGGDGPRAVRYLRAVDALLRKLDGPIERDTKTTAFQAEALASIGDFDLKEFYARLPEQYGDERYFSLQGSETPRGYRLVAAPGHAGTVSAISSRRSLGDSSSTIRMRHVEANDKLRYWLHWRAGVGVGALAWPALVSAAADAVSFLEERPAYAELPLLLKTADSHLKKSQPALHEEDRRVLASAWGSFPALSKLGTSLSRSDDVIALEGTPQGFTHLRLVTRWDQARLASEYPHLAGFFRDLGNLIESHVRLLDAQGNLLAELFFDSEKMRVRLEAFVRAGQLVPSRGGRPLAQAARFERMRAQVDVHVQSFGLHMYLDDLTVELQSEQHETGASLALQLKQTPRFRARGAAFGVFPAGMLDWFIPGDIEGLARRMMDVTMRGNGGNGVTIDARFEQSASGLATLDGSAALEILDTALIRFGMKIAADRVMPDDQELADIARLARSAQAAFRSDLERFARYGKLPQ
jgi:hypothetical protein